MVADDETNEVLGVSMVGHNAGEVIYEAAMALRFQAKERRGCCGTRKGCCGVNPSP
jgi:pyruvate/2-oxoglutarate dehydrogenase complex dihydrolipoamide dehydrogenase (E3) component